METTIIMFFKLCIFIIAPFQSPMEAAEEPRGNAASLMGGLPKAANNWRRLSFPRLMSHQLFVFVYQQEIYPGKTRRPATWRAAGCQAHLTKSRRCLRCKDIAMLSIRFPRGKLRRSRASRRQHIICVSLSLSLFFFFFRGSRHEHLWHKDKLKKWGGEMIHRAAGRGWLIHSQEVISRISVMVAGDCWPSRIFLPGWQTTKHNGVFHSSWFIASETSSKATEAKNPPRHGPPNVPDVNHIQVIWRWVGGGDEQKKKKMGWSVAGRW